MLVNSLRNFCKQRTETSVKHRLTLAVSLFSLTLFSGIVLTACNSGAGTETGKQGSSDNASIVVQGSDTMEEMVREWANGFMTDNKGVQVTVRSGDTGSGITGLIEGKIDLASASRELTEEENKLAHARKIHLRRHMVARDAIAVIVNPQNDIDEIGLDDLRKLYSGEISTWDQLVKGAKQEPIRVFGRELSSGTSDYFKEHVMGDKSFASEVKLMPSSEAVIGAVYGNRLGIGFVGMSQARANNKQVKILELSLRTVKIKEPAVGEAASALSADTYPLSRPLYLYYDNSREPKLRPILQYVQSEKGRKVVESRGFMTSP
ncbi:MAG: PstS family phosphate ABC transporter substrate-binding protein [Candidatus Obscuribacter phosphatis]|uniref:PstS family phosphate ABC transporter substrate-binding protein n=1 Tax=Candidatus Obscuribacter phosphatis TaxID=1906157 RepID=A0A8J7P7H6_9BACT|nr:PstS family phosphate ABC transporter substrate-binding protein [Candidatus Obscuribacter phosphatis]